MTPGILNFTIYQGATFRKVIYLQDSQTPPVRIDLTDCSVTVQIKTSSTSDDVLLELNSSNGRARITDAPNGVIELLIVDEDTPTLLPASVSYVLDIEYADGSVDRYLTGKITSRWK